MRAIDAPPPTDVSDSSGLFLGTEAGPKISSNLNGTKQSIHFKGAERGTPAHPLFAYGIK